MKFFQTLLDIFIPPQCIHCQQPAQYNLCNECLSKIPYNITLDIPKNPHQCFFFRHQSPRIHQVRTHNDPHLKTVVSITPFRDPLIRQIIHQFKYKNLHSLSLPLSKIILKELTHFLQYRQPFVVCPIPLHPKRQSFRGYNQSELLASNLSKDLNLPLYTDLTRTKHTPPQMSLAHPQQRKNNIAQAFTAPPKPPTTPSTILIIDDVTTTLSTLSEAAKELHKAGFSDIYAITIAR